MINGIYLPALKREALFLGDTSGTHLHPFFVHFAELAGSTYYQEILGSYCMLPAQAMHLQCSLDALHSMREEDDPLSLAQAYFYMGMAHAYMQAIKVGKRYFKKCVDVVQRNKIRFVPISNGDGDSLNIISTPPESQECVHERVVFLAQMVYLEDVVYIIG